MPTLSSPDPSFLDTLRAHLPTVLPQFLLQQRWFGGKAQTVRSAGIEDIVSVPLNTVDSYLVLVRLTYTSGTAETYAIPLLRIAEESGPSCLRVLPGTGSEEIVLTDALSNEAFLSELLGAVAKSASFAGSRGQIGAAATSALPSLWQPAQGPLQGSLMKAEQSNSSVVYEKRLVLKLFRRLAEGLNPDLEIGAFLTERTSFRNVPVLAGYLEYRSESGARTSLGILQGYVANQGDAWQFTLRSLAGYYGCVRHGQPCDPPDISHAPLLEMCTQSIPAEAHERIGSYLESAALLGKRTAELHLALASVPEDPAFAPQPFSEQNHQAFANSAAQLLANNFELLRRLKDGMPEYARLEAERLLGLEGTARRRLQLAAGLHSAAMVTRIHGDYHLGQVLFTGNDFVIIDFEGEPARPLEERRQKRSPLQDVAGMLRSFHYAAYAPLLQSQDLSPGGLPVFGKWALYWQTWVSATFLKEYFEVAGNAPFIPKEKEELGLLLELYLLDKAVYELGYELNNRPTWVRIPLDGISQLLQG